MNLESGMSLFFLCPVIISCSRVDFVLFIFTYFVDPEINGNIFIYV